ncbi:MAG: hypothetical protein M1305_00650, partial [Candidatus Marsarchaeota archaeon]|nr:hypothetical protein [Candidatus Marsarchaeota archaeon]
MRNELDELLENYRVMYSNHTGLKWNKYKGDYCARMVKDVIAHHLLSKPNLKVVGPNVFLQDLPPEIDLLIVTADAEPSRYTSVYPVDKARAWIEVKAHGTYGKKAEISGKLRGSLVKSFNEARSKNSQIKCAYLTFAERCNPPKNGKSESFWKLTLEGLDGYAESAFCLASTPLKEAGDVSKHRCDSDWNSFCRFIDS